LYLHSFPTRRSSDLVAAVFENLYDHENLRLCLLERAMGIEPTSEAWEACNLTQKTLDWRHLLRFSERFNREIMENENARRADRRRRSTLNGSQSLYSISTRTCPHSPASLYN